MKLDRRITFDAYAEVSVIRLLNLCQLVHSSSLSITTLIHYFFHRIVLSDVQKIFREVSNNFENHHDMSSIVMLLWHVTFLLHASGSCRKARVRISLRNKSILFHYNLVPMFRCIVQHPVQWCVYSSTQNSHSFVVGLSFYGIRAY